VIHPNYSSLSITGAELDPERTDKLNRNPHTYLEEKKKPPPTKADIQNTTSNITT